MSQVRIARRYAKALIEIASEKKELSRIGEDFKHIEFVTEGSREFLVFLKNPVISKEKKKNVFREVFGSRVHTLTSSFLSFIVDKGREEILSSIITQYFHIMDENLGIVNIEVRAASDLSEQQTGEIKKKFESMTKKTVKISFSLDKQILGGFVVKMGDTVFDASVRNQLQMLRERFAQGVGTN